MVVASVVGNHAHTALCPFQHTADSPLQWSTNTTLILPKCAGVVQVAGKVGDLLITFMKRPSDAYLDLFVLEDFFEPQADYPGISLESIAFRIRCVESALRILLENRRLWDLVSDHLLARGMITDADAQTFLVSCAEGAESDLFAVGA